MDNVTGVELTPEMRMDVLKQIAKVDTEYKTMFDEMYALEDNYNRVLGEISTEQMDVICDFVSQCEGMSYRMLELACIHMRFGD